MRSSTLQFRRTRPVAVNTASSKRGRAQSDLAIRAATAVVGIPVVLALDHYGGWIFGAAVGLVAAIAAFEFYRMMRVAQRSPVLAPGLVGAIAIAVAPLVQVRPFSLWVALLVIEAALTAGYVIGPWAYRHGLATWESTISGIVYIGLPFGFLTLVRTGANGAWWVVVVLVITWAYDTGAYLTGRAVGKRPFMQHISPSKTVEGVAGGLVASTLAGLVASLAIGVAIPAALALGFAGGIVAQAGDLVESMFKRQSGVKDSGVIVPGHGGILDRIDSLMFVAVLVYYAAIALGYA